VVYLRESSIMLTVNNELEGTWKEVVVVKFEVLLWHMPEGPEENQIKVTMFRPAVELSFTENNSENHRLFYYMNIFTPSERKS